MADRERVDFKKRLGASVRDLRLRESLSQTALASKAGMRRTTIFCIERGLVDCHLSTLLKLADFFEVSLDELCGRDK